MRNFDVRNSARPVKNNRSLGSCVQRPDFTSYAINRGLAYSVFASFGMPETNG
jgi:hypothetical protein